MAKAPRREPDWGNFQFFLAVAQSGTLSEAGRQLRISHTTVGRRITALEKSLGFQLFQRKPHGYELTLDGKRLLDLVLRMAVQLAEFERERNAAPNSGLTTGT